MCREAPVWNILTAGAKDSWVVSVATSDYDCLGRRHFKLCQDVGSRCVCAWRPGMDMRGRWSSVAQPCFGANAACRTLRQASTTRALHFQDTPEAGPSNSELMAENSFQGSPSLGGAPPLHCVDSAFVMSASELSDGVCLPPFDSPFR
jgi:hypothetical protein